MGQGGIERPPCGGRYRLRGKSLWGQSRPGREGPRRGTRGEPDFPDGDGRRISSREPQGSSASPDVVRERNVTVDRMRIHTYTGGNVGDEDGDVGVDEMRKKNAIAIQTKNPDHPSIRRIRDGGVSINLPCRSIPPDDVGYTTCLEVPADDK